MAEELACAAAIERPRIIKGGVHADSRGSLVFFNEFGFSAVERFYIIRPSRRYAVRGWTGHRRNQKWFTSVEGVFSVAVVTPDDWQGPDTRLPVSVFILAATNPRILVVPPGHATAIVGFTEQAALVVFSTGRASDDPLDTYRFPPEYWSIPDRPPETTCESF